MPGPYSSLMVFRRRRSGRVARSPEGSGCLKRPIYVGCGSNDTVWRNPLIYGIWLNIYSAVLKFQRYDVTLIAKP